MKLTEEQTIKKKNALLQPQQTMTVGFFVMPSLNAFKKINFNKISICGIFFFSLLRIKCANL